jgi:hypothetical protein
MKHGFTAAGRLRVLFPDPELFPGGAPVLISRRQDFALKSTPQSRIADRSVA